jgi:hypothetical protein
MDKIIPILSLIVSIFAVFVGPLITYRIASRQMRLSLEATNKQIIAPMRQTWINSLRDALAELLSSTQHFYVTGYEYRKEADYQRIALLEYKILLMLNSKEEEHIRLEALIRHMIGSLNQGKTHGPFFEMYHSQVKDLSRTILKHEWDRVKEPILF